MSYKLTIHSPFKNNVGINFSVMFTDWYVQLLKTDKAQDRYKYTADRLKVITEKFKLIKVYSLLTAGWEKTLNVTPESQALIDMIPYCTDVECVIGTTLSKDWFKVQENVNSWIDILWNKLQLHTTCVKAILIGNEINANNYTPQDIKEIMGCFKIAQARYDLNIPVTVDFSNLPIQAGDDYSDSLVKAVVDNWGDHWNDWYPFVFINPYPDASGINDATGVFDWQGGVSAYYQAKYPRLQILIGETGAEGSDTEQAGIEMDNSIFTQLNNQYKKHKRTVPTFMFEAVDEGTKPLNPNQQHMGLYNDEPAADGSAISIKAGLVIPDWIK